MAWSRVPAAVRASIEDHLGSPVASARSQQAGFSPALATRLVLTDERRVFVKAIGPDAQSGSRLSPSSKRQRMGRGRSEAVSFGR